METPLQTSPPLFGFIINCYTRRMRQSKGVFNLSFEKKKEAFFYLTWSAAAGGQNYLTNTPKKHGVFLARGPITQNQCYTPRRSVQGHTNSEWSNA